MKSILLTGWLFFGAIVPFTERGTTDFDTFLHILNPHGKWTQEASSKIWSYTPLQSPELPPFINGRWIYSDYGWHWQGNEPYAWATSHYGFWKRTESGSWSWIPSPEWHSNPVDWRGTQTHIGWRPSALNKMGDFVESEEKRVAHPEEWIFVKKEDFDQPLTLSKIITGADAQEILLASSALSHEAHLYRVIPRAGPDPTLFPRTLPEKKPTPTPSTKIQPYITMALPTFWTPLPSKTQKNEIYIYRPQFFQDKDGIQRRIHLWMNPQDKAKKPLEKILNPGT